MAAPGFTELNKAHWDSTAATYLNDNEKLALQVTEPIRSRRGWVGIDFLNEDKGDEKTVDEDEDETVNELARDGKIQRNVLRMLDYACGPGMVSRALGPYVTQTLGLDISDGMVKEYNDQASHQGLSPDKVFAVAGNLLDPKNPSPEEFRDEKWFNFDLAVVGFGFHHFEDPVLAAGRLAERLRPGGVLLIIDILHDEHFGDHWHSHSHGHSHHHHQHHHATDDKPTQPENEGLKAALATVAHYGFTEEQMQETFEKAGVGKEFGFEVIAKSVEFTCHSVTKCNDVFMAKGRKA